jgi:hypothetical protein
LAPPIRKVLHVAHHRRGSGQLRRQRSGCDRATICAPPDDPTALIWTAETSGVSRKASVANKPGNIKWAYEFGMKDGQSYAMSVRHGTKQSNNAESASLVGFQFLAVPVFDSSTRPDARRDSNITIQASFRSHAGLSSAVKEQRH